MAAAQGHLAVAHRRPCLDGAGDGGGLAIPRPVALNAHDVMPGLPQGVGLSPSQGQACRAVDGDDRVRDAPEDVEHAEVFQILHRVSSRRGAPRLHHHTVLRCSRDATGSGALDLRNALEWQGRGERKRPAMGFGVGLASPGRGTVHPGPKSPRVASVRPAPDSDARRSQAPLRVAVAAILSPSRNLDGYHDRPSHIGKRLGRSVQLVRRGTYGEVNELLKRREIDLARACGGAFVVGEREFGMQVLAVPQIGGGG
jgi:hypothetical protein